MLRQLSEILENINIRNDLESIYDVITARHIPIELQHQRVTITTHRNRLT